MVDVTRWSRAVRSILKSINESQAKLAETAGIYPMKLSRCLSGRFLFEERTGAYEPDAAVVRSINRATAELCGVPAALDYLNALAFAGGLLTPERGDFDLASAIALLVRFNENFVDGAQQAVTKAFKSAGFDDTTEAALFVALAAIRGKELVARLEGRTVERPPFDAILQVFREFGAPLDQYVRQDQWTAVRRARESFAYFTDIELASFHPTALKRALSHANIMDRFDAALVRVMEACNSKAGADQLRAELRAKVPSKPSRRGKRKKEKHS